MKLRTKNTEHDGSEFYVLTSEFLFAVVGQQVSHYRIHETLGTGGMGIVYAGEDVRLGRPVAVKFLPEDAGDSAALERFRREARTASALNHPHICTIYDIGEHEGRPFIVMELLRGATLADRIATRPMRISEILEFSAQGASALDAAHRAGIVHRDIKPANVFVTDDGHVKVLDFGVSKLTNPRGVGAARTADVTMEHLTGHGATIGTIGYMSPEQLLGEDIDARSDLFSLGVVIYEMLAGGAPFKGTTGAAVIDAILHAEPPPILARADVPDDLQRVVFKSLDKDRSTRYQSAADLRADLLRVKRALESGTSTRVAASSAKPEEAGGLRLVQSWEAVARDGREFAERGSGMMYWFRVPLGGICYPDGFRNFLQPALDNRAVTRIRFVLDHSEGLRQTWSEMVMPLINDWAGRAAEPLRVEPHDDGGSVRLEAGRSVGWIFVDLSQEFTPCFKLFVDDPNSDSRTIPDAQVFLATSTRTVRLRGGAHRTIRIPDTILRVQAPDQQNLLTALTRVANQWDLMFP